MTGILPGKNPGYYSIDDKNKKKIGLYSSKREKAGGKVNYYRPPTPDRPPSPPCCATCATCARCVGAGNLVEEDIEL